MSPYEKELALLCYEHFKETSLKDFTYRPKNGNDMVYATNAVSFMEDEGYVSDVIDNGFTLSFTIKDSLIRYMKQAES